MSSSFFQKIKSWIPRPFLFLQRQLEIQSEWKQFKQNIRPHRYKIYFLTIAVSYPLYSPIVKQYYQIGKQSLIEKASQTLKPDQPAFQIGDQLVKNLIESILKDSGIKREGLQFVERIILDEKFVEEILNLLLSALKNQKFLDEVGVTSKELILTQLRDPQVQSEVHLFIRRIASSEETKRSFINLIKEAFSSKQSVDTIVNLLEKGVSSSEVKVALSDTVNFTVRELLADEQTLNQIKIFAFFLLRKFENDDQIKSMMDILFAKGLGLVKKTARKNVELEKILKAGKNSSSKKPGSDGFAEFA